MVRAASGGLHSNLHNFNRFSTFVKKPLFVLICHNYTLSSACLVKMVQMVAASTLTPNFSNGSKMFEAVVKVPPHI